MLHLKKGSLLQYELLTLIPQNYSVFKITNASNYTLPRYWGKNTNQDATNLLSYEMNRVFFFPNREYNANS